MGSKGPELASTLRKRIRFWLALNPDIYHLPKLIPWAGGLVLFIVGLIWLMYPIGPVTHTFGTVLGLGFYETDEGSIATASVRTEDGVRRIRLPTRFQCRIGDTIELRRRPTRMGEFVAVARTPRPCSRLASR